MPADTLRQHDSYALLSEAAYGVLPSERGQCRYLSSERTRAKSARHG